MAQSPAPGFVPRPTDLGTTAAFADKDPLRFWPSRSSDARLGTVARPTVHTGVQLDPGSEIFTMGSCFARNIEDVLETLGFSVPTAGFPVTARDWRGPRPAGLLNVYTTPTMRRSLALALRWHQASDAERPGLIDEGLEQLPSGVVDDLLAEPSPLSLAAARARRVRALEVNRRAFTARVVVLTLGLIECWFDRTTGLPLARSPGRERRRTMPERYIYRQLSVADVIDDLEAVFALLRQHGHPELEVLLSVSPVPMTRTFEPTDVLVANMQSKSVLRVAAGEVSARHDFVSYVPTYEAVMLSQSPEVWEDDLRHVAEPTVAALIERVVRAHLPAGLSAELELRLAVLPVLLQVRQERPESWPLSPSLEAALRDLAAAIPDNPPRGAETWWQRARALVDVSPERAPAALATVDDGPALVFLLSAAANLLHAAGHSAAAMGPLSRLARARPLDPDVVRLYATLAEQHGGPLDRIAWRETKLASLQRMLEERPGDVIPVKQRRFSQQAGSGALPQVTAVTADLVRVQPQAVPAILAQLGRLPAARQRAVREGIALGKTTQGQSGFDSELLLLQEKLLQLELVAWEQGVRQSVDRVHRLAGLMHRLPGASNRWLARVRSLMAAGDTRAMAAVLAEGLSTPAS